MDAPPIQYARTEDGVNIAYSTLGAGPVFVIVQPPSSSGMQPSWADPYFNDFYGRLAESFTVVSFDFRGTGGFECPARVRRLTDSLGGLYFESLGARTISAPEAVYRGPEMVMPHAGLHVDVQVGHGPGGGGRLL